MKGAVLVDGNYGGDFSVSSSLRRRALRRVPELNPTDAQQPGAALEAAASLLQGTTAEPFRPNSPSPGPSHSADRTVIAVAPVRPWVFSVRLWVLQHRVFWRRGSLIGLYTVMAVLRVLVKWTQNDFKE